MAVPTHPILSFNSRQFRAKLEIFRAQTLTSKDYPPEILKIVLKKMNSLLDDGQIAFFDLYEDRLKAAWSQLRDSKQLSPDFSITITIAAGAPDLPGLIIEPGPTPKSALIVSTSDQVNVNGWSKEWVRTTITHKARHYKIQDRISMAHVQACIIRILAGHAVNGFQIPLVKATVTPEQLSKVFSLQIDKGRGDIILMINDIHAVKDAKTLQAVHATIIQTVERVRKELPGNYRYFRQELIECIGKAATGPEAAGIGLPMLVLAVVGDLEKSRVSKEPAPKPEDAVPVTPVKYFSIGISADKMTATINSFDKPGFKKLSIEFNREWFESQLLLFEIKFGLIDDIWEKIFDAYKSDLTLEKLICAQGNLPLAGEEPYLHLSYKDAPVDGSSGQIVDIREAQQRTMVKKGQLVAEVMYKKIPVIGQTVTGQIIQPASPKIELKVGDGIKESTPGQYVASFAGIPMYDNESLSISKTFIHKGDVDLKSGNIRFDGPVEITGSVDSGATVDVRGPLTINGMVRGGLVFSKTTITVKQGVVTTENGLIKSKGNITADFIENSVVQCGASIIVNKALLNSQVFAGNSVIVNGNDGTAGGGTISCKNLLMASNVGFPSGARTKITLGVDVKILVKIASHKRRVQKVKLAEERYRLEIREISGKKDSQVTQKIKDRKNKLLILIPKAKKLLEKLEGKSVVDAGKVTYNMSALMVAHKKLSTNCDIEVAGINVPVPVEMLAAAVSAKKKRDSHLCTTEDVKLEIERLTAQIQPGEKKAG